VCRVIWRNSYSAGRSWFNPHLPIGLEILWTREYRLRVVELSEHWTTTIRGVGRWVAERGGSLIFLYIGDGNWRRCGGKICFSPPQPLSSTEDWAMAGVRWYRDNGDGLGDGGVRGSGVAEMDRVTGVTYSVDPGVDSLHHILYLVSHHLISYHLIIPRLTHSIFRSFWSHSLFPRLHLDPHNCVDPRSRVVSDLLTLFLRSSSQNRSLSLIPFWMPREVRRSVDTGLSVLSLRRVTTNGAQTRISGSESWVRNGGKDPY